jgi:hypothetical protein
MSDEKAGCGPGQLVAAGKKRLEGWRRRFVGMVVGNVCFGKHRQDS